MTQLAIAWSEFLNPDFEKFHLHHEGQHLASLHRFTAPDLSDPHDHPWDFTSHVLRGGYVEEIFTLYPDGSVIGETVERRAGTSHRVKATTIHRIVRLLGPDCWTIIVAGPPVRETLFWRFGKAGVLVRRWDEDEVTGWRAAC